LVKKIISDPNFTKDSLVSKSQELAQLFNSKKFGLKDKVHSLVESLLFVQEGAANQENAKKISKTPQPPSQEGNSKLKVGLLIDILSRLQPDTLKLLAGIFSYCVVNTMVVDQTSAQGDQDSCSRTIVDSVRNGLDIFYSGNMMLLHYLYSCDIISSQFLYEYLDFLLTNLFEQS